MTTELVDLQFSDEQRALHSMVREFFAKESPIDVVRAAEPLGHDAGLWRKAVELGLPAIAVPERYRGAGAGRCELAIVAEGLGYCLAPIPLIEAAAAANLLAMTADITGNDDIAALAAQAATGELLATVALHPARAGVVRTVPAGAVADLVIARGDRELMLIRRDPQHPPPVTTNLGCTPLADWPADTSGVRVIAIPYEAALRAAYDGAVTDWRMLTAAALVGLGRRALEIGIDYVLQRSAFGVLIATFQTIQHRLVDHATALEGARLLAYEAAWACDEELPMEDAFARMAFAFASEAAFKAAADSLHFHGGYGYTMEYDIQLFFRRAKAWPQPAGDPRREYIGVAHRLFDAAVA